MARPLSQKPDAIRKRRQRERDRHLASKPNVPLPATLRKRTEGPKFRVTRPEGERLVAQASAAALARGLKRIERLRSLPNVNNPDQPDERLYVPNEPRRGPARLNRKGAQAQAEAIREHSKQLDIKNVGRARRAQLVGELDDSEQSSQYKQWMSPEQQERFQALSEKIASIPLQALGILFDYANGANSYSAVIGRLTGSPDSIDVEEALGNLAGLAEVAERARTMYSPKAIGDFSV